MKGRQNTRAVSATTRSASVRTWQWQGRHTRTLKTRRLAHTGNPRDLIVAAASMLPGEVPVLAILHLGSDSFPDPSLKVSFGRDNNEMETYVEVTLQQSDVPVLYDYFMDQHCSYSLSRSQGKAASGMMHFRLDAIDDDGGSTLKVPTTRETSIETMSVSVRIQ